MLNLILIIIRPIKRIRLIKVLLLKLYYFLENLKTFFLRKISKTFPNFILKIAPKSIIKSQEENIILPPNKDGIWETLIDGAKSELYNKINDYEKSKRVNTLWSTNDGYKWIKYDKENTPIKAIAEKRKDIFNLIDQHLYENKNINTICEIGTGDGRYLNFLSKKLPYIKTFIGVDLNSKIIQENNKNYIKNNKLIFISGKVNAKYNQIKELSSNSILFVSFRTLTWFTQIELEELFNFISNEKDFLSLAFFEQNEIDISKERDSKVRTGIVFNSHNYNYLLKKCGLKILKEKRTIHNNLINDHEVCMIASNKNNSII